MMPRDDEWMAQGSCWGTDQPDIFFPDKQKGVKTTTKEAKSICRMCPVRVSCLFYAVAHGERDGVWGGFSEVERRRLSVSLRLRMRRVWFKRHPKGGKPRQESNMEDTA